MGEAKLWVSQTQSSFPGTIDPAQLLGGAVSAERLGGGGQAGEQDLYLLTELEK